MKKLREKRGDYVLEGAVKLIAGAMLFVLMLSALGVASRTTTLHNISSEAMRYIEVRGMVDGSAQTELARLQEATGLACTYSIEADFIPGTNKVQFGDRISIRVSHTASFGVGGIVSIPITLNSVSEGRSEVYWK